MVETLVTLIFVIVGVLLVVKIFGWWNDYEHTKIESNALAMAEILSKNELIDLYNEVVRDYASKHTSKKLNAIKIYERALKIKENLKERKNENA